MDMQERITECYNIPENDKEIGEGKTTSTARKAVDDAIYKAGYSEALNTVVATRQYDEGYQAGQGDGRKETWDTAIKAAVDGARRDVVEWVELHWFEIENNRYAQGIWIKEWIAQNKIWGI